MRVSALFPKGGLLFGAFVVAVQLWSSAHCTSINITLYYEGLCADCHDFFLDQLWPTYNKLEEYLHVDLVPFGKAHMKVANGTVTFQCQHGPQECYVNEVQTCAVKYVHPVRKLLDFVACMFRQDDPTKAGQPCAEKVGTYWPVLDKCSRGPEGEKLLREMGERTLALKPPMKWVPYVQVNGAHDDVTESLVEHDLFGFACKLLEPSAPRVCRHGEFRDFDFLAQAFRFDKH
ncbi:gamma-interferon-inducible lysosomal thiol reductase-like [Dermacentor variabilis]|uniref:gamma-interferon-inducible lysosomal thiol reductase-like n=1 Tax=Dermacentor variabilis TaxID=34621 RepID=UPI003F5BA964